MQSFIIAAFAALVAGSSVGCTKPPEVPSNLPTDVGDALACVLTNLLAKQPLTGCIAQYGAAIVADALQMLTDSITFRQEHADLLPTARDWLAQARSAAAGH
jgi:hypothetical protein